MASRRMSLVAVEGNASSASIACSVCKVVSIHPVVSFPGHKTWNGNETLYVKGITRIQCTSYSDMGWSCFGFRRMQMCTPLPPALLPSHIHAHTSSCALASLSYLRRQCQTVSACSIVSSRSHRNSGSTRTHNTGISVLRGRDGGMVRGRWFTQRGGRGE